MATQTAAALKKAFRRFVKLLEPIEEVRYVFAIEDGPPEVFTYVDSRDESVYIEVFHAEYAIDDEYPDLAIEFHVRSLNGHQLKDIIRPIPRLFYSREARQQ